MTVDKELAMSALESETSALGALRTAGSEDELAALEANGGRRVRLHLHGWRRWVSPLIVLVIWQLTHVFNLVAEYKFPPPTYVASTAYNLAVHPTPAFGSLQGALAVSSERFAVGFFCGLAVAVIMALAAGLSRVGEAAVDPLMQAIRTLPLYGLLPMLVIWFGIGAAPKILLVALGGGIPVYLNLYAGIRAIDGRLYELARVLELNRREQFRNIVLPGALPTALIGVRQGLGAAWLALVVAEQINATGGLGYMITQAEDFDRNDVIMVALMVYTILGLLTDWVVRLIERRALAWRTDLVTR